MVVPVYFSVQKIREWPGVIACGRGRAAGLVFSVAAWAAIVACGAVGASAQTVRSSRRPPLPVASVPAKNGATTKTQIPAPQVIAVVHRLSGWKLRTLLTPPEAPVASTFDESFVRTNIVAGYILADGRTVVARLPQAEAEMLNLAAAFGFAKTPTARNDDAALLLVRSDGAHFNARFIGLDASTGLSLLESDKPLHAPASEVEVVQPVVGPHLPPRRVRPMRPSATKASST